MPISIRIARESDAAALLAIYAPYVRHTAITFEYDVPSLAEFTQRIRTTLSRFPYLVAECDGEIIGYAYASPLKSRAAYAWAVETSIYVRTDRKRGGVGRLLYDALEALLLAQGVTNLNACIATPQVEDEHLTRDSVAFHERLGYRLIGEFYQCGYKFKRWYNMVWMEKLIAPHLEEQSPVTPFSEMIAQATEVLQAQFGMAADACVCWYHGSPYEIDELLAGSTITPWRALAEAFSHKPVMLAIDDELRITQNGTLPGFLYRIAEPLEQGTDVIPHPRTSMDDGLEWLTARPLRLEKIACIPAPDPEEIARAEREFRRLTDAQL